MTAKKTKASTKAKTPAKATKDKDLDLSSDDFIFPTDDGFEAAMNAPAPEKKPEIKAEKEPEESTDSEEEEEEPEFTKEELLVVFDEILFEGHYEENFKLRGKLPFTLKSRTAGEAANIARVLDKTGFNMMVTIEQHAAIFNLAHSLVNYNGEDLSKMPAMNSDPSVMSRYDFISKLPGTIVSALYNQLSKFDRKVQLASIEGSENF